MDMAPPAIVIHPTNGAEVGDDNSAIAPGGGPSGDVKKGEFYIP
jgi:hypothetical protein